MRWKCVTIRALRNAQTELGCGDCPRARLRMRAVSCLAHAFLYKLACGCGHATPTSTTGQQLL